MKKLLFLLAGIVPAFAQTSATLSVTADGTTPFSYSWKKDGAAIAGATGPSLVLSPLATTSSGLYLAQVTNSAGTATAPANLVVLAASTTAPAAGLDKSKFLVQAGLVGNWSPVVGQWDKPNYLAIVPIKKISDVGNHFNDATGFYTVGPGEGGFYAVHMLCRCVDNPPPYLDLGIVAGTDNQDKSSKFDKGPGPDAGYVHFTVEHTNYLILQAGAQIRCNIFVGTAVVISGYDVTFERLF